MFNDVTKIKELFSRLHLKLLSISFQNLFFQNFTCQTQGAAYTESVSELIGWFLWCSNLCCIHFKYQNMGKMKRLSYINTVYLTGLVTLIIKKTWEYTVKAMCLYMYMYMKDFLGANST